MIVINVYVFIRRLLLESKKLLAKKSLAKHSVAIYPRALRLYSNAFSDKNMSNPENEI